jgi:hypothetical protein
LIQKRDILRNVNYADRPHESVDIPKMSQMPSPSPQLPGQSPLTDAQRQELNTANQRAGKIRSAAKMASFNGWTTAVFAAFGLALLPLLILMHDSLQSILTTAIMAGGLGVVAWNELAGRKQILAYQPAGAKRLAFNQLGFMTLLIGYCLWSIYLAFTGPNEFEKYPEVAELIGTDIGQLYKLLSIVLYGSVALASVGFQGGCALYYYLRYKMLRKYLTETPAWVVDLLRLTSGG